MTRFLTTAVSLLLLLADPSSSANLRSIAEHGRRLSHELIAYYEPKSQVTDHNALDLDQSEMEDQLAIGTDASFEKARKIYEQGGHSKSVAKVKLSSGLLESMSKGTEVSGQSANGAAVYGKLYDDYPNGASTIEIQYKTIDSQSNYVECQVGGLPQPNLLGCLADNGTLDISGTIVNYSYDSKTENVNKRTLQKFSTSAEEKMYRCDNCPYKTFQKFRTYYGYFDYADKWINAAFDSKATNFAKGNANFVRYGFKGRAEAIKKATAYMSVWMYVIRELEDALDDCKSNCKETGCNDDPVRAWDEAVAFYTGSLEGTDGTGSGKMLYALADKRCKNFKTCGPLASSTEGTSHVNEEIIRSFALGSRMITQGKCVDAAGYKERIEQMMTVPLIQGVLRYAYITATDPEAGEKAEAEGATFAAAILPIINACDEDAADTVYENMKTQKARADFTKTKKALESVYACMGVRGKDVGGLWDDETGSYFPGAKPLSDSGIRRGNVPLIIGCTAGGLVAGIILYLFVSKCCCSSTVPVELKEDPMAGDSESEQGPSAIMKEDDVLPSVDSQCEPVEIS